MALGFYKKPTPHHLPTHVVLIEVGYLGLDTYIIVVGNIYRSNLSFWGLISY